MALSWAQAVDVAKRLNPAPGQRLVFSADGSVLSAPYAQQEVARLQGEVYACTRESAGQPVTVARVTAEELEAGREPSFGTPW